MGVRFILYKPGYMAYSGIIDTGVGGASITPERYFATDVVGKEVEIEVWSQRLGRQVKWRGPLGIVEMKRAKTFDERRIGGPSTPTGYTSKELPLIFKAIRDDRKERGLEVR